MSWTQKNNHDGQVCECRWIQTSLTIFSLFCSLFFVFFQTISHPFFGSYRLYPRQSGSFDCCFFDDFSLVQQSQQRQLTENLFFHFFFVCIPSSNTSVAFRLIVCNLRTFVTIEGTFDCQVLHFFAVVFCQGNKL